MAAYDVLHRIVKNGNDLTIANPIAIDVLEQLVDLAAQSGSKITVTTKLPTDVIDRILARGKAVSFVDGLTRFEQK